MCFYSNLSKLCEINHISVSGLLSELNMSASNKQKWQNGSTVNSAVLIKIADYFDCSVDYLLGRTDYISKEETTIHGDHNVQASKNGAVTIQQGTMPERTLCSELEEMLETLPRAVQHRAVADMMELLEKKYLSI